MKTRQGMGEPNTLHDVAVGDTVAASEVSPRPSAPGVGAAHAGAGDLARGDSIGRFVVLGVLGAGGMGVVYSAYDPHLDRKVAIKLLGSAAASSGDAASVRLLREAQAMAKINHPNVIKVHEVGTFGDQVFVAMEFADAGTLRGWLKQAPRTRQEILDVFVAAGRGLGAAHAAGLVHRDFKPDNVLMSMDGSIRVTDFGLVSVTGAAPRRAVTNAPVAVEGALGEDTPLSQDLTRTGSILGTPTYMAPEQFSSRASTPATDQFAFCVALYEALYGERPFAGATYGELSSSVLLGEIAPPPRGTHVPGRLRNVLVRGLATDPDKRYPSMAALLADLTRNPAQRRRVLVGVALGVALLGGGAAFAVTRARRGGSECKGGADRLAKVWNAGERAKIQAALAATKLPHAAASFQRLASVVDDWGQRWQLGYTDACEATRVRGEQSDHLLDLRMLCLSRKLDDAKATLDLLAAGGPDVADRALSAALGFPAVSACSDVAALTAGVAPPATQAVRLQVGGVHAMLDEARAKRRLGRYADGLVVARSALAMARTSGYEPAIAEGLLVTGMLQDDVADKASPDTLREAVHTAAAAGDSATMTDASAWLIHVLTQTTDQYGAASELASLADAMARHTRPSPENQVRLDDAIAMLDAKRGDVKAAQARYDRALALAQKELGPDHAATVSTLQQVGNLAKQQGHFADARKYLEQVVASIEHARGKDHPDTAAAINDLANVYRVQGDLANAKQLYERSLAIRIAALGPDHPDVGTSYNNLSTFYADAGDNVKAAEMARKALALWEARYGKDNIQLMSAVNNLGAALVEQGDYAGGRAQYEHARKIIEAAYGPDHPDLAGNLNNVGVIALKEKKYDEAYRLFDRAVRIVKKAYGPDHPDVADYMANETTALKRQNKLREAKEMTSSTLAVIAKAYGPDHPRMGGALVNYGALQIAMGDNPGAIESFKRALTIFETKLGPDHPYVAFALNGIGGTLVSMKKEAEAVPYLERAVAIRVSTKQNPSDVGEAEFNLALALVAAPKTRTRARTEAQAALHAYEQVGDADEVKHIKTWLAKH